MRPRRFVNNVLSLIFIVLHVTSALGIPTPGRPAAPLNENKKEKDKAPKTERSFSVLSRAKGSLAKRRRKLLPDVDINDDDVNEAAFEAAAEQDSSSEADILADRDNEGTVKISRKSPVASDDNITSGVKEADDPVDIAEAEASEALDDLAVNQDRMPVNPLQADEVVPSGGESKLVKAWKKATRQSPTASPQLFAPKRETTGDTAQPKTEFGAGAAVASLPTPSANAAALSAPSAADEALPVQDGTEDGLVTGVLKAAKHAKLARQQRLAEFHPLVPAPSVPAPFPTGLKTKTLQTEPKSTPNVAQAEPEHHNDVVHTQPEKEEKLTQTEPNKHDRVMRIAKPAESKDAGHKQATVVSTGSIKATPEKQVSKKEPQKEEQVTQARLSNQGDGSQTSKFAPSVDAGRAHTLVVSKGPIKATLEKQVSKKEPQKEEKVTQARLSNQGDGSQTSKFAPSVDAGLKAKTLLTEPKTAPTVAQVETKHQIDVVHTNPEKGRKVTQQEPDKDDLIAQFLEPTSSKDAGVSEIMGGSSDTSANMTKPGPPQLDERTAQGIDDRLELDLHGRQAYSSMEEQRHMEEQRQVEEKRRREKKQDEVVVSIEDEKKKQKHEQEENDDEDEDDEDEEDDAS